MSANDQPDSKTLNAKDEQISAAMAEVKIYRDEIKILADNMTERANFWRKLGRKDIHDLILKAISLEQVPEHILRRIKGRKMSGASFSAAMSMTRGYERILSKTSAKGCLDLKKKKSSNRLANALGLKFAERYQDGVPLGEIFYQRGSVIKPVYGNGSSGVMITTEHDELISVSDQERYQSLDEFKSKMRYLLHTQEIKHDLWISEEFLQGDDGQPANDLKFYTFYGKVAFALEVKRHPEVKYCFHKDGEILNTGKYQDLAFVGDPIEESWVEYIKDITARIPLPFIRVDMYRTVKGMYFGEFTTVPGGYQNFNLKFDRLLGEYYNSARARIFEDFLSGKKFPEFTDFVYGKEIN